MILYMIFLLIFIFYIRICYKNLRDGVIVGLVFITFTPFLLPFDWVPINGFTIVFQMIFIVLVFLYVVIVKKEFYIKYSYLILLTIFFMVLLIYTPFSKELEYGISKTLWFLLKVIFPLYIFSALSPFNKNEVKKIYYTVLLGGLLTFLIFVLTYGEYTTRGSIGDANPITVARTIGLSSTVIFSSLLFSKFENRLTRIIKLGLFLALLFGLILTGSRAPLITVFITMIITVLLSSNSIIYFFKKYFNLTILISLIFFIIIASRFSNLGGFNRIRNYFLTLGENTFTSDMGRINRYTLAVEGFQNSYGFGIGTGGFADLWGSIDWPHNIVLEIAVEQGIIGLIFFITILIIVLNKIKLTTKNNNINIDAYGKSLIVTWVYLFLNSLVSGDLTGNYLFWIVGSFPWLLYFESSNTSNIHNDRKDSNLINHTRKEGNYYGKKNNYCRSYAASLWRSY